MNDDSFAHWSPVAGLEVTQALSLGTLQWMGPLKQGVWTSCRRVKYDMITRIQVYKNAAIFAHSDWRTTPTKHSISLISFILTRIFSGRKGFLVASLLLFLMLGKVLLMCVFVVICFVVVFDSLRFFSSNTLVKNETTTTKIIQF